MTYKEAVEFKETNSHLIGKTYDGKTIHYMFIAPEQNSKYFTDYLKLELNDFNTESFRILNGLDDFYVYFSVTPSEFNGTIIYDIFDTAARDYISKAT